MEKISIGNFSEAEKIKEPPFIRPYPEWSEPFKSSLSVNIRGDVRVPRYAEAVNVPEAVFTQAEEIGAQLSDLASSLPELIRYPEVRQIAGITSDVYKRYYEPFLNAPHTMDFFGVDAILANDDSIKAIEINTRPQVLGRYDITTPLFLKDGDPNAMITPRLSEVLNTRIEKDSVGVVVSHPLNAFHKHHELFAQQSGLQVFKLQDLQTNSEGNVMLNDQKVGLLFRQFATRNLFQSDITDPLVLEAIKKGKINVVNSPISDFMGEKTLFPYISHICPGVTKYLPRMEIINTGEDVDLKEFSGWWLKGETRGQIELVLRLTKQNLQGWPGQVVRDIVAGDTEHAGKILEGKDSTTAMRLREHISDIGSSIPPKWVLQENIEPKGFMEKDEDGEIRKLYSTLRIYYVRNLDDASKPYTYIEFLAGKNARVSAAGFTVPVRRAAPIAV